MASKAQLYMDAVITPNRSLSKRGLVVVLSALAAYNLMVCVFLLSIGAFPVPIFLGLDFMAVVLAFHVSNGRATRSERVRVSADVVEVERDRRGRPRTVWRSPTAFTRVALEQDDGRNTRVELRLSGRAMPVGAALSPAERTAFAEALTRAITAAQGERYTPAPG